MFPSASGFRARMSQLAGRLWEHAWLVEGDGGPTPQEEPLRAELFSAEQMERHGKRLAALHVLGAPRVPDRLLARLASNERVLVALGRQLAATADAERRFSPAAEWLLDNFYLIEEEIRTARRHLPRGYSRELPRLARSPDAAGAAGMPRVYHLALHLVAHGDGLIGRGTLMRFIAAYQSVQPLLLGELWAIPIMLRLALIENLRRVAARVATAYTERETAGTWADSMLEVAENAPSDLILLVADMARSAPPLTNAFVAEFARRLQGHSASLALPLTWIELRLAESGQTLQDLVQMEGQQQAANQVSVSNSIGSLRLLSTMDWREFVEALSGVEQTLRDDPSGVYAQMSFDTRDRYRHVVEAIGRISETAEVDIARQAVALCAAASAAEASLPRSARRQALPRRVLPARRGAAGPRAGRGRAAAARAAARARGADAGAAALCRRHRPGHPGAGRGARDPRPAGPAVAVVGRDSARRGPAAGLEPARHGDSSTGSSRSSSRRSRCRGWTTASASLPRRGRWWWCRPCSAAPPGWRRWSRRSRCASSPTAIRTCTSAC